MSGTQAGGKAAAVTNKAKHGPDFYRRIGSVGGKLGKTGGFGQGEEGRKRASVAGRLGGLKSRRVPKN